MLIIKFLVANCVIFTAFTQITKVLKRNVFLSRRKRYLNFPMGSNFVITLSLTKPLMEAQPKGYTLLQECDIPFALPSDTRIFQNYEKHHNLHKRHVFSQIQSMFSQNGLNGTACVKRIMCETKQYITRKGKSLVRDLLSAIFMFESNLSEDYENFCEDSVFLNCPISFFNYIIRALDVFES